MTRIKTLKQENSGRHDMQHCLQFQGFLGQYYIVLTLLTNDKLLTVLVLLLLPYIFS